MDHKAQDTACADGFNYCFWAKFIVGVPAVFIIAYFASAQFTSPFMQVLAGSGAGILAVYVAMKIDKMPALSGKIVKKD